MVYEKPPDYAEKIRLSRPPTVAEIRSAYRRIVKECWKGDETPEFAFEGDRVFVFGSGPLKSRKVTRHVEWFHRHYRLPRLKVIRRR